MSRIMQYDMEIEVITPVHVAGADYKCIIKKNEYVHDKRNQVLTVIDTSKFVHLLSNLGLVDNYIKYIEETVKSEQRNQINLYKFLTDNKLLNKLDEFTRLKFRGIPYDRVNDITLHIANANGNPYIPGSAIKGSLINVMLVDYIIRNRDEFKAHIVELITASNKMSYRDFQKKAKKIIESIEELILYGDDGRRFKSNGVSISDTYDASNLATNVFQDIDIKRTKEGDQTTEMPKFREYIETKSLLKFSLGLNLNELEKGRLNIRTCEDVLSAIDKSCDYLYSNTLKVTEHKGLIIGANTGYHQKSIIHALIADEAERIKVVRKLINTVSSIKKPKDAIRYHLNDKHYSPRVINKNDFDYTLSGIVKLTKLRETHVK